MKYENLGNEYALVGATVIDGNGGAVRKNTTIVIKEVDEQIFPDRKALRQITPSQPPIKYRVISQIGELGSLDLGDIPQVDVSGSYIIPGLMDIHMHYTGCIGEPSGELKIPNWLMTPEKLKAIRAVKQSEDLLDWGYTTVRCCGGPNELTLKHAVEEGSMPGPRIFSCGKGIITTCGEADLRKDMFEYPEEESVLFAERCDGVENLREMVRKMAREGVDFIKVWISGSGAWYNDNETITHFFMDELNAVVETAARYRLPVAAHCLNIESIKMAVEAGVNTIEHFYELEGALDEETCQKMVEKNIFAVATMSTYFGGGIVTETESGSTGALKSWEMARRNSVKFAMGSDLSFAPWTPYGPYGMGEIKLMVEGLGMTPMEAIVASTKTTAEALGVDAKLGTLEEGKIADLLILKENPAENVDVLQNKDNILHVVKEGRFIR